MAQTILITGSNTGFGRLMAQSLAARGHTVFAGMRDVAGRNATAAAELQSAGGGGKIVAVELDPSSDASVDAGVRQVLEQTGGTLDVAINNAGYGTMGLGETFKPAQLEAIFSVNVVGPQRVSRAVLPAMRARGAGLIVHISSAVGRMVLPAMGVYCASKFALEALAEAYRYELAPLGIDVAIVEPGAFPTSFMHNVGAAEDPGRADGYGPIAQLPDQMTAGLKGMFAGPGAPDPQRVADAVVQLIEAPAGQRPLRTLIDPSGGEGVRAINQVCEQVQTGMLTAMGMSGLLGAKPAT